jgi:plastocyanin
MKLRLIDASALVVALASFACGSSTGTYSSVSTGPTGPSGSGDVTISILSSNGLGNLGANSFSPNPASVTQGMTVVWHNNDSTAHHIVLDNGSLDTGTIAAGASTTAMTLNVTSATYHCTIHPTMVGSINTPTTPAPGSGY